MATRGIATRFQPIASIAIVADNRGSASTTAFTAAIVGGTGIAIIAGLGIGRMDATGLGAASVIGAGVAIVAVDGPTTPTKSLFTGAGRSAGIAVVTEQSVVGRQVTAASTFGSAMRLQADGPQPFGGGASDHGTRLHTALVWQRGLVAEESAVAEVSILQVGTVCVLLAVAGDRRSQAIPSLTLIPNGAGVIIVTSTCHRRILATTSIGADVFSAGVFVVALDRIAHADHTLAMVRNCTSVAIRAIATFQDFVYATLRPGTLIARTGVAIIAKREVLPFHEIGFIDFAITVVVHTIAGFGTRRGGIAIGQTTLDTMPFSLATSELIGNDTVGSQAQYNRAVRTGTFTGIIDTLLQGRPVHRFDFGAGKAPGAVAVRPARTAAEIAVVAIVQACVLGPASARAISIGRTGPAEIGVAGNTDIDHVRVGAGHLLTGPPGRALLLASL